MRRLHGFGGLCAFALLLVALGGLTGASASGAAPAGSGYYPHTADPVNVYLPGGAHYAAVVTDVELPPGAGAPLPRVKVTAFPPDRAPLYHLGWLGYCPQVNPPCWYGWAHEQP